MQYYYGTMNRCTKCYKLGVFEAYQSDTAPALCMLQACNERLLILDVLPHAQNIQLTQH